jgi:hypothetical protein
VRSDGPELASLIAVRYALARRRSSFAGSSGAACVSGFASLVWVTVAVVVSWNGLGLSRGCSGTLGVFCASNWKNES